MARKKKSDDSGWVLLSLVAALLHSLTSSRAGVLEDVRTQFNKDKGSPRLVVLVSPT